jgi:hypothetical protein
MEILAMWLLYTAPTAVAIHRMAVDRSTLAVMNLLTGWTGLGWFVCLLWAALGRTIENGAKTPSATHGADRLPPTGENNA